MKRREKALGHNKGLNAMGAEVVNSTFVLVLNFCTKLNICASNPPLRQAPNRYSQWFVDLKADSGSQLSNFNLWAISMIILYIYYV